MFITIQSGDYTININLISEIDWTEGDDGEALVTMASGYQYSLEEDDVTILKEKLGIQN